MLFRPAPLSGVFVLCLRPASLLGFFVRHSKITKLFQLSQLSSDFFRVPSKFLQSFFDIPRIVSRSSESLDALRIASLVSAPLLFFSFQSLLALSASFRYSLRLFDIPRIISRFSESLAALRIASLVSVSLFFFSFLISEPLGVLRIASFFSSLVYYSPFFSLLLFFFS